MELDITDIAIRYLEWMVGTGLDLVVPGCECRAEGLLGQDITDIATCYLVWWEGTGLDFAASVE